MSNTFSEIHIQDSGRRLCGKIRTGVSGDFVLNLILRLEQKEGMILCKDRPKITAGCADGYFIKRYNLPGVITQLRRRFKTPRPFKALAGAGQLSALHISTPRVVAALVERRGILQREYLVTESLPENVETLNVIAKKSGNREAIWQIVKQQVMPAICRLHGANWAHGDLSLRNIYLSPDSPECGFIDLDGARYYSGRSFFRENELARLISSFLIISRAVSESTDFVCDAVAVYRDICSVQLNAARVEKMMKHMINR